MARIALALVLLALTAQPAYAGRAYGVLVPGDSLLTFEVEGNTLRAAALRASLGCDDEDSIEFAANFKIARRTHRGEEYLVPLRSRPGTLRHRIVAEWFSGRDRMSWRGTLTVTRLEARKPRVHLLLRESDRYSDCVVELTRLARREPGVLYTGGTDDDEPVWLRRLPEGVEWVAGYGSPCRPDTFMQGFHEDLLPLTGATFGRSGLIGGFHGDGYDQSVALTGTLAAAEATGTQRLVGDDGLNHCDTKERRWRAVTG
jgi:hypothetical protein